MIDVEKIVNEQSENLKNARDEQKQNFIEMATHFGNFFNCLCKQNERSENEKNNTAS